MLTDAQVQAHADRIRGDGFTVIEAAANAELVEVIAKAFAVAKRDVTVVSGEHSKLKRVVIATLERDHIEAALRSFGIDPTEVALR